MNRLGKISVSGDIELLDCYKQCVEDPSVDCTARWSTIGYMR